MRALADPELDFISKNAVLAMQSCGKRMADRQHSAPAVSIQSHTSWPRRRRPL